MTTTFSATITPRRIPRKPADSWLLGDLNAFSRDRLIYLQHIAEHYSPIVAIRLGPIQQLIITSPAGAQHVLQSNNRNYQKEPLFMNIARLALRSGNNLFTSDGDYWLKQRRLMQPSFHRKQVAQLGDLITAEIGHLLTQWETLAANQHPLDVSDALMHLTMQIIGRTMLNVDMQREQGALHEAYAFVSSHIVDRSANPLLPPLWVPTPINRKFTGARNTIHQALLTIIRRRAQVRAQARVQDDDTPHDLLDMLLAARYEESGGHMSEAQLLDELFGIVSAGHETTSMALTWAFYLLAQHPAIEQKLHAEVDRVLGGRLPTANDVEQLSYTRMVLQETMRLYPPAYVTTRQAMGADQIEGYTIPAGARVLINIYGLQRHANYWPEPERFDPERFAPAREASLTKFAYLPFGAGPRKCIGEPLAMLEAQLILATIAQRYRLRRLPERPVQPNAAFVLRAQGGLWMRLEQR